VTSGALAARFRVGERVRVDERAHDGHHRTPWYIKGKTGTIVADQSAWPNPETRAYGASGLPLMPVYRVLFNQTDLWNTYAGPATDTLIVDIFQHWLEPVQGGEST
jgi:nitrile hydratase